VNGQVAVYTLVFKKPAHEIGPPPPPVATVTLVVLLDEPPALLAVAVNVVVAVTVPLTCCVFAPPAKPPVHEKLSPEPVLQSIDRLTEPPPTGSELGLALSAQPLGPVGVLDQLTVFVGEGVNTP
jgi:hypothetical protein